MKYFEVEIGNNHCRGDYAFWLCIKGIIEPTIEEVNEFLKSDIDRYIKYKEDDSEIYTGKYSVVSVTPICKAEAGKFYDFENESEWPIFGS